MFRKLLFRGDFYETVFFSLSLKKYIIKNILLKKISEIKKAIFVDEK